MIEYDRMDTLMRWLTGFPGVNPMGGVETREQTSVPILDLKNRSTRCDFFKKLFPKPTNYRVNISSHFFTGPMTIRSIDFPSGIFPRPPITGRGSK